MNIDIYSEDVQRAVSAAVCSLESIADIEITKAEACLFLALVEKALNDAKKPEEKVFPWGKMPVDMPMCRSSIAPTISEEEGLK